MNFETILLEKKDRIATIWFNRPDKLNAASPQVFKDLDDALTDIEKDDDIRVVILTGKGDAFSAGADVGKFEFDKIIKGVEFIENVAKPFMHIEYLPKPVIAAVNGYAFGFGTGITLACAIKKSYAFTSFFISLFVEYFLNSDFVIVSMLSFFISRKAHIFLSFTL